MYYRKTSVWNTVAPLRDGLQAWSPGSLRFFLSYSVLIFAIGQGPLFMTAASFKIPINCQGSFYEFIILRPNSYYTSQFLIQTNTTRELLQRGFNPLPPFSQSTVSDKYKELIVLKVTEGILCDEILRWASVGGLRQVPRFCCKKLKQNRGTW